MGKCCETVTFARYLMGRTALVHSGHFFVKGISIMTQAIETTPKEVKANSGHDSLKKAVYDDWIEDNKPRKHTYSNAAIVCITAGLLKSSRAAEFETVLQQWQQDLFTPEAVEDLTSSGENLEVAVLGAFCSLNENKPSEQIDEILQKWFNHHSIEDAACQINTAIAYLLATHSNDVIRQVFAGKMKELIKGIVSADGLENISRTGAVHELPVLIELLRDV